MSDLSSLGHFLKGSSATLGLNKVKEACEKIQHYGAGKDETGTVDEPDEKTSLKKIEKTLGDVKKDYKEVEGVKIFHQLVQQMGPQSIDLIVREG